MNERHEFARSSHDLNARFDAALSVDDGFPVIFGRSGPVSRAGIAAEADRIGADPALRGLPPGRVVAVAVDNGPGFLAAVLTVWSRDAVALLIDAQTPAANGRDLSLGFGAVAILRGRPYEPVTVERLHPRSAAEHRDAAVIKLTSGSSGNPRGVLVSPRAVLADTLQIEAAMGIGAGDRVGVCVPMSFSYGFGSLAVPALLCGRQLVEPDPGRPLGIMTAARRDGITVLPTVPVFLASLLRRDADWQLPESIRLVISAGAPLPEAVARRFRERFGQPVHVFYGASECGGITYDPTGEAGERGTVGAPVPGVDVRIEQGVVEVRSPSVGIGYLPPDPALDGARYRTADLGRFEAGELRLLGRHSDHMNLGGQKVDPREVEAVITRLAGVEAVSVFAIESEQRQTLCCAVVESRTVTGARVRAWCQQHLAPGKCPRRIVVAPELPRDARGKLRADLVRELVLSTRGAARS